MPKLTARKIKFSLVVEQIVAFASILNMVTNVKKRSPNFRQIM